MAGRLEGSMTTSTRVERPADVRPLPASLTGHTAFWVAKLGWSATKLRLQALEPLGLRPKHYAVLSVLVEEGPRSQQALGEALNIDASTMVALIDDLERDGLAERRRNPEDRRAYAIQSTAAGNASHEQARRAVKAMDDELLAPLDDAERELLHDLLVRVAAEGPHGVPEGFSGPACCRRGE